MWELCMFFFLLCMFLLQFECVCTPNTAITRSGIAFFFGGGGGLEGQRPPESEGTRAPMLIILLLSPWPYHLQRTSSSPNFNSKASLVRWRSLFRIKPYVSCHLGSSQLTMNNPVSSGRGDDKFLFNQIKRKTILSFFWIQKQHHCLSLNAFMYEKSRF